MPRNVRNFWIELEVDGRKQRIATGPAGKDGGFHMTIYQRAEGEVIEALHVQGVAYQTGELSLRAYPDKVQVLDSDDIHVGTWR